MVARAKRLPAPVYEYRLVWSDPACEVGCAQVWAVSGGREEDQVALEKLQGQADRWHCTCPHAVYRAEPLGRVCKHVLGITARLFSDRR